MVIMLTKREYTIQCYTNGFGYKNINFWISGFFETPGGCFLKKYFWQVPETYRQNF